MAAFDSDALAYNIVADKYERGRPGYLDAVVDHVVRRLGEGRGPVVDLAAGTGKLTRALAARSVDVIAVEPVAAMAAAAQHTAAVPALRALAGALPFRSASVAGMTVAQAFQWFTAADVLEIGRVLAPGATLALVWNRRLPTGVWLEVNAALASERNRPHRATDAISLLSEAGCFGPVDRHVTPWVRTIDGDTLRDHIGSLSWVATLEGAARERLSARVDDIVAAAGPEIALDYEVEVLVAARS